MPRHQRLAIVAVVACLVALIGVALLQALPGRAVSRRTIVQAAASAPAPAPARQTVPLSVAPATAAPTTATIAPPATAPPTTAPRVTAAPPVTAAPAPHPTTPPATKPPVTAATRQQAVIALVPRSAASGANPSDYTLIGYRWNPCQIITVSTSGPDAGSVGAVITEIANITGLRFMMVSSGGAISVGWGGVNGGGIGQTVWRSQGGWMVAANVTVDLVGAPFLGSVLHHELGHAMGLGHASQINEVMYPTVGVGSPTDYQAGDLAGLRAVGGHC